MKTTTLGDARKEPQITPGNRTFRWQIDTGAIAHIIEGLSDMYGDPLFATAREEISNAMDANRRVKATQPVEVSFPSAKLADGTVLGRAGDLVIRDYGPGMNAEDLEAYFSYGFTDKKDVNTEVGGFGLGSKSPLSFVDTFSITSVKDGLLYEVLVHRDVQRVGLSEFVREAVPVKQPNGVTIRIPITPEQSKRLANGDALRDTLIGYPHGSILLNGQPVVNAIDTGNFLPVTDLSDVAGWVSWETKAQKDATATSILNRTRVLVGGVLYELPYEVKKDRYGRDAGRDYSYLGVIERLLNQVNETNRTLYLTLPVGSVHMPRSRDKLTMDEHNRDVVIAGFRRLLQLLPGVATARLNQIDDPVDAARFYAYNWGLWETTQVWNKPSGHYGPYIPSSKTMHTTWRGNEVAGEITVPGRWEFFTSYHGNGFSNHGVLPDGEWPFYAAARKRLSYVENTMRGYLRPPKEADFVLEAGFVLQVPKFTDALAADIERKIRIYGRNVLHTTNVAVLVTDETELPFWARTLLPVETWDGFIEKTKAVTRAKREEAALAPATSAQMLQYPVVDWNSRKLADINSGDINTDAIYLTFEESAAHPYTNATWDAVKRKRWDMALDSQFATNLAEIVGSRQVIMVPPDRSLDSFVKRYAPQAENFTQLLAAKVREVYVGDDFQREVFESMALLAPTTNYAYGRDNNVVFLQKLREALPDTGEITNPMLAAIIQQIGGNGDLYRLLRMAQAFRPGLLREKGLIPDTLRPLLKAKNMQEGAKHPFEAVFALFAQGRGYDKVDAQRMVAAFNTLLP